MTQPFHLAVDVNTVDDHYSNRAWEVRSYPSGTVIVCLAGTGVAHLSHFYVYGPAIGDEDTRDRVRYSYAEDLARLLNANTIPAWFNTNTVIVDNQRTLLRWPDRSEIHCVANTCGEDEARRLFRWFLEHIQDCRGAMELMQMSIRQ